MTTRSEKVQATRQKLIQVTDELINQRGFENISVADITQACGIAKGTFYNYFSKKEAIFAEISQAHFSQLDALITDIPADQTATQTLSHYLIEFMTIITTAGVTRARDWIRFVVIPSPAPNKWDFDAAKLRTLLKQLIAKKQLAETTPVEQLADFLVTYLYGLVFGWGMSDQVEPQSAIVTFCQLILPVILQPYLLA
ncbi:TetR/AcrR family transcriptional regulator [Lapidilactobacillus wuchangensis]|uniref:TetR/AcrR family transcriptional regulator n=1 Tax=Lapidilactobacillus wuchangensis TaxID=2486001 RepID=UPI000F76A9E3|nr:TetR/AcrR family transcriptional regulator [Lapidilactobacillus wuchangensis]